MQGKIGHYTIVGELGRGGMGVVYKAHEESLNRYVAIKVLGEHLAADPSFVARFVREAQAAAALSHPNIIQIFFIGEDAGRHFFVMEFVTGLSLLDIVKKEGRVANRAPPSTCCRPTHGSHRPRQGFCTVTSAGQPDGGRPRPDQDRRSVSRSPPRPPPNDRDRHAVGTPGYLSPEQS
jgi:serine/threonine protein kinase